MPWAAPKESVAFWREHLVQGLGFRVQGQGSGVRVES